MSGLFVIIFFIHFLFHHGNVFIYCSSFDYLTAVQQESVRGLAELAQNLDLQKDNQEHSEAKNSTKISNVCNILFPLALGALQYMFLRTYLRTT